MDKAAARVKECANATRPTLDDTARHSYPLQLLSILLWQYKTATKAESVPSVPSISLLDLKNQQTSSS